MLTSKFQIIQPLSQHHISPAITHSEFDGIFSLIFLNRVKINSQVLFFTIFSIPQQKKIKQVNDFKTNFSYFSVSQPGILIFQSLIYHKIGYFLISLLIKQKKHISFTIVLMSQQSSQNQICKSLQGPLCQLCFTNNFRTNMYFAKCQTHDGICYKCGEMYMLECINKGKKPVCFFECGEEMCTGGTSLFQYFQTSHKQKWKMKEPELRKQANLDENHKLRKHCKTPNCSGIIKRNKCPICGTGYCEVCGEIDHDPTAKCQRGKVNLQVIFDGAKKCPKCSIVFIRDEGCMKMTCSNCNFQFCYCCLQPWTNSHHTSHGVGGCFAGLRGFFSQRFCCGPKIRKKPKA